MNRRRNVQRGVLSAILLVLMMLQGCQLKGGDNQTIQTETPTVTQALEQIVPTENPVNKASEQVVPTASPMDAKKKFEYDKTIPLNVEEISTEETDSGIKVTEITYDAYDQSINPGGKISAYRVMPSGEGPFPCVLFFHWYDSINSNKNEFLDEAKELAAQGIAGVLIDGYFPWKQSPTEINKDKALVIYQVIEVSRALDYIESIPNIDKEHLGYVGHDYGAMFGCVSAGIDRRVSCYIFMTAMGNFSDWFLQYWTHLDENGSKISKSAQEDYRAQMSELDPINFICNAAPAKLFFQFSKRDRYISDEQENELYEAASEPKEMKTYAISHQMLSEEARSDRINWLVGNLLQ